MIKNAIKHSYALELAAMLAFEWDYDKAGEYDLYEAVEAMGYEWNVELGTWVSPESPVHSLFVFTAYDEMQSAELDKLTAWKSGLPIKG